MSNQVRIRKINLEVLIDTLTSIYDAGADYIDIIGTLDNIQDVVNIVVQEEYLTEDTEEDYTNKLSDEDINNLLDE